MASFAPRMTAIEENAEGSNEDVSGVLQKQVRFNDSSDEKVSESGIVQKVTYIAVEGNLTTTDSFIFGLNNEDTAKIVEKYPCDPEIVTNGVCVKGFVIDVVNTLDHIGFSVVDVAGVGTKIWTMVKKLE